MLPRTDRRCGMTLSIDRDCCISPCGRLRHSMVVGVKTFALLVGKKHGKTLSVEVGRHNLQDGSL